MNAKIENRTAVKIVNRIFIFFACLSLVFLLGLVDYLNGYELSLSLLYLVPIYICAWYLRGFAAAIIAVMSAFAWGASNIYAGISSSAPYIPGANFLIRSGVFLAFATAIRKIRIELDREREFADIDFMTGVKNSHAFFDFASQELKRSRRYGHTFTVAYLDCDNFKLVNDSRGHTEGDNLLRLISRNILNIIRTTDFLARLGGDEFIMILPETDFPTSREALERIRSELNRQITEKGYPVTLSMGAITYYKLPDSVDEMIKQTDELMYRAKKEGKNQIIHELVRE